VRLEREAPEDLFLIQRLQEEVKHLREELVAARSSIEQLQANPSVNPPLKVARNLAIRVQIFSAEDAVAIPIGRLNVNKQAG
jgi:hypothetical protein